MIDVDKHFAQGSAGHMMASQAVEQINAAKAAGMTDQANKIENGLMDSITRLKESKGKDLNGFKAYVKEASSLEPEIKKIVTKRDELNSSSASIKASLALMGSSGAKINPETIKQIELAKASGDPAILKPLADSFNKTAQNVFEQSVKPMSVKDAADVAEAKQKSENEKNALIETLKEKYINIVDTKNHPQIRQAFGIPLGVTSSDYTGGVVTSRLIPGSGAAVATVGVNQLADQEWIDSIIKAKAAGATFGALSDKEGGRLASAASKLSQAGMLDYEAGNKELQKMAESVKKLYTKATGRNIAEDVIAESKPSPEKSVVDDTKTADDFLKSF